MKKWKLIAEICVVMATFCACGVSEKTAEEVQAELVAHEAFFDVQQVQIQDFEIIKRQTDQDEKEDLVYVQVVAENEKISCNMSYCLQYGLYDSGWILDEVSVYDGGVNKITPKSPIKQSTPEVLMDISVPQGYELVEQSADLEQGECSYTYGYYSQDGLEYFTSRFHYVFNEEKVDWDMAGIDTIRTITAEPDMAAVDADMQAAKGDGFVCVEQTGDMEAGLYTFWYERAREGALCTTHERYRLEYRFNDSTRTWRQEGHAEEEESKSLWKDIAGTWLAVHKEKDSYFSTKPSTDVYYQMVVTDVTEDTFSMKLYRNSVLVAEDNACRAGNSYEIVNENGADIPYRSNIKISGDGFYFYAPIVENVYFTKIE